MTKAKDCPHGPMVALAALQVCKLGPWDGKGPYALFVDRYGSGSYQLAKGSRREMFALQKVILEQIGDDWSIASAVYATLRSLVPEALNPERTPA